MINLFRAIIYRIFPHFNSEMGNEEITLEQWEKYSQRFTTNLSNFNYEQFFNDFQITSLEFETIFDHCVHISNSLDFDSQHPIKAGFEDIFYYFLLSENFNFSKSDLFKLVLRHMKFGSNTLVQVIDDYFNQLGPNFLDKVDEVFNQKKSNLNNANCKFFESKLKKDFFEKSWDFFKKKLFPRIVEMYGRDSFVKEFIDLASSKNLNTRKQGEIALFHLGLLGKFQRGELQVFLNKD